MTFQLINGRLHRTRGDIAAFKRDAKRKYGPKALWPRDILIKYEWLKECAAELQDRLLSNEELAA